MNKASDSALASVNEFRLQVVNKVIDINNVIAELQAPGTPKLKVSLKPTAWEDEEWPDQLLFGIAISDQSGKEITVLRSEVIVTKHDYDKFCEVFMRHLREDLPFKVRLTN